MEYAILDQLTPVSLTSTMYVMYVFSNIKQRILILYRKEKRTSCLHVIYLYRFIKKKNTLLYSSTVVLNMGMNFLFYFRRYKYNKHYLESRSTVATGSKLLKDHFHGKKYTPGAKCAAGCKLCT